MSKVWFEDVDVRVEDDSITVRARDGGPVEDVAFCDSNLYNPDGRMVFALHWDKERLAASDALIKVLCQKDEGKEAA